MVKVQVQMASAATPLMEVSEEHLESIRKALYPQEGMGFMFFRLSGECIQPGHPFFHKRMDYDINVATVMYVAVIDDAEPLATRRIEIAGGRLLQ